MRPAYHIKMSLPTSLICIREGKSFNCAEVGWLWLVDALSLKEKRAKELNRIIKTWYVDIKKITHFAYTFEELKNRRPKYNHILLLEKEGVIKSLGKGWTKLK